MYGCVSTVVLLLLMLYYYSFYVCIPVCPHTICMPGTHGGQKKVLEPLELSYRRL